MVATTTWPATAFFLLLMMETKKNRAPQPPQPLALFIKAFRALEKSVSTLEVAVSKQLMSKTRLMSSYQSKPLCGLPRRRPPSEAPDVMLSRLELLPTSRAVLKLRAVSAFFSRASNVGGGAVVHFQAPGVEGGKDEREKNQGREQNDETTTTARIRQKRYNENALSSASARKSLTRAPRTSGGTQGEGTRTGPWAGRCRQHWCCLQPRCLRSQADEQQQEQERLQQRRRPKSAPLLLLLLSSPLLLHCHH